MKIILAREMGMCFGVRDALEMTASMPQPQQATILGQLVHNPQVLVQLTRRGFEIQNETEREVIPESADVVVTAHGISNRHRQRLENAGKRIFDTTCPLVRKAHAAALELMAEGRHVLIIGRRGYVEVEGLTGDLDSFDVLQSPAEVMEYQSRRLGIICQTTTTERESGEIRAEITRKNPQADIRFIDTICRPTKERQDALDDLLNQVDAMVVIGGRNSNNTVKLLEHCIERNIPVLPVESATDLDPALLKGHSNVGVTAGTSTLDSTIRQVVIALETISGPLTHPATPQFPSRAA